MRTVFLLFCLAYFASTVAAQATSFSQSFSLTSSQPFAKVSICGTAFTSLTNTNCFESAMTFTVSTTASDVITLFLDATDFLGWENNGLYSDVSSLIAAADTIHSCPDAPTCTIDWFSSSGNDKMIVVLGSNGDTGTISGEYSVLAGVQGSFNRYSWQWDSTGVDYILNLCDTGLESPAPIATASCSSLMARWSIFLNIPQNVYALWTNAEGVNSYLSTGELPPFNLDASHVPTSGEARTNGVSGTWFLPSSHASILLIHRADLTVPTNGVVSIEYGDFASSSSGSS